MIEHLVGAADELSKYVLSIGQRWGLWKGATPPGEGATVIRLAQDAPALAQVTAVRLGRYRWAIGLFESLVAT